MSQYVPHGEFKWLNKKEINGFCLNSIEENSSVGYILGVDLKYPDKLRKMHNDYPLAPERLEISQNMLSKYCSNIADEYGKNLKLYLSLGMKLTKFHRTLKFKQCNWLKKYIDFNTNKRKNPANIFLN